MTDRTLPRVIERNRMTEAEARVVGYSATRIAQLRELAKQATSGTLTLKTASATLTTLDVSACIALLIEREASLLSGFNIELATE